MQRGRITAWIEIIKNDKQNIYHFPGMCKVVGERNGAQTASSEEGIATNFEMSFGLSLN